jgi:hypothetical protein
VKRNKKLTTRTEKNLKKKAYMKLTKGVEENEISEQK